MKACPNTIMSAWNTQEGYGWALGWAVGSSSGCSEQPQPRKAEQPWRNQGPREAEPWGDGHSEWGAAWCSDIGKG